MNHTQERIAHESCYSAAEKNALSSIKELSPKTYKEVGYYMWKSWKAALPASTIAIRLKRLGLIADKEDGGWNLTEKGLTVYNSIYAIHSNSLP